MSYTLCVKGNFYQSYLDYKVYIIGITPYSKKMNCLNHIYKIHGISAFLLLVVFVTSFTQTPEMVFTSGFEDETYVLPKPDLVGTDLSTGMDWVRDFDEWVGQNGIEEVGYFTMDYGNNDTGTAADRLVELVPDPEDPGNQVLKFWIKNATNPIPAAPFSKGRIQANLYNNEGFENFTYSIRWYVPKDLDVLREREQAMLWMIVFEFWNNVDWRNEGYEFRINVQLKKPYGIGQPFRLRAHSQKIIGWVDVWDYDNEVFEVPTGQWMTVNIHYVVGDDQSGKFYMDITPDGGTKKVIFDITNFTHHPDDPAPNGVRDLNPFKLYSHKDNVDVVRNDSAGKYLHFFWDDFELWVNKDISTGVNNPVTGNSDSKMSTYLNIRNGYIDIALNENETVKQIRVLDYKGRVVLQKHTSRMHFDIQDLEDGAYFVLIDTNKMRYVKKVLLLR